LFLSKTNYSLGGVDIFLDSVGGSIHQTILTHHMNLGGRICIFGNLALYGNQVKQDPIPPLDLLIALKGLSIFGFNVYRHLNEFGTAMEQLATWLVLFYASFFSLLL